MDNREDALAALQNKSFCLILLDLQIKSAADAIKGHVEHGKALLRKIREKYGDHNGTAFWLPVLIVSGFAREVDEAVDVMKDGASDVIQKPLENQQVSRTDSPSPPSQRAPNARAVSRGAAYTRSEFERRGRDRDSRRQD